MKATFTPFKFTIVALPRELFGGSVAFNSDITGIMVDSSCVKHHASDVIVFFCHNPTKDLPATIVYLDPNRLHSFPLAFSTCTTLFVKYFFRDGVTYSHVTSSSQRNWILLHVAHVEYIINNIYKYKININK